MVSEIYIKDYLIGYIQGGKKGLGVGCFFGIGAFIFGSFASGYLGFEYGMFLENKRVERCIFKNMQVEPPFKEQVLEEVVENCSQRSNYFLFK